jgi:hypothetical protein
MLNFKINEKPNHPKQRSLRAPNIDLLKREFDKKGAWQSEVLFFFYQSG